MIFNRVDPTPPQTQGAPYLARSLRQMWETTNLRTGDPKDHHKPGCPRFAKLTSILFT